MKFAQLVIGPAGCGKSTYCNTIQQHCHACGRSVHVFNLGTTCTHPQCTCLALRCGLQRCGGGHCLILLHHSRSFDVQTRQQRSSYTNHLLISVILFQWMMWCKSWIWGRMGAPCCPWPAFTLQHPCSTAVPPRHRIRPRFETGKFSGRSYIAWSTWKRTCTSG